MSTKKKKENTEKENRAIVKAIHIALIVTVLIALSGSFIFSAVTKSGDKNSEGEKLALWNSILPGSVWNFSDSSIDSTLLKADLKYCRTITFGKHPGIDSNGNRVYNVFIKSSKDGESFITFQAYFTMDSSSGGTLLSAEREYDVHFSDMRNQSFDSNEYLMRISVKDYGYLDLYFQNN